MEVTGERTLAYFMTHEIVHSLEVSLLGRYAYVRMPAWKREGYADYVARNSNFVFAERLAALRNNAPEMDPHGSGLYLRYQLLVSYLLDVARVTPDKMLTGSFAEAELDRKLRTIHLRRVTPPPLNVLPARHRIFQNALFLNGLVNGGRSTGDEIRVSGIHRRNLVGALRKS